MTRSDGVIRMVGYITQPKEDGYYGFIVTMDVLPGDERPVFYLARTMSAAGAPTTGVDVYCPGFQPKKDASTRPGDIIPSISELNGTRQYIALKVFKRQVIWH
uniref:Uncharacterized protein n=1 Tax=Oryza glumipatula TaxID=40148 RepID=A0A0E0ADG3_9ORYZ